MTSMRNNLKRKRDELDDRDIQYTNDVDSDMSEDDDEIGNSDEDCCSSDENSEEDHCTSDEDSLSTRPSKMIKTMDDEQSGIVDHKVFVKKCQDSGEKTFSIIDWFDEDPSSRCKYIICDSAIDDITNMREHLEFLNGKLRYSGDSQDVSNPDTKLLEAHECLTEFLEQSGETERSYMLMNEDIQIEGPIKAPISHIYSYGIGYDLVASRFLLNLINSLDS